MIFASINYALTCADTVDSWFEGKQTLSGENHYLMRIDSRFNNSLVLPPTSNELPVHLVRNASQLIVQTSVHLQGIKWRTDFISISPFFKAIELNDQPESKRFGSIAFWNTGCRRAAVGSWAHKPAGELRLDVGIEHVSSSLSLAAHESVLSFEKKETEGILETIFTPNTTFH